MKGTEEINGLLFLVANNWFIPKNSYFSPLILRLQTNPDRPP